MVKSVHGLGGALSLCALLAACSGDTDSVQVREPIPDASPGGRDAGSSINTGQGGSSSDGGSNVTAGASLGGSAGQGGSAGGGAIDAGTAADAASDGGFDDSVDAGVDDAANDARADDAANDAGADTGLDAGPDSGLDASTDAGECAAICVWNDECCPSTCDALTDGDCGYVDVEIWYDGQSTIHVEPALLTAGINSGVMLRWKNVGQYTLDVVKFGTSGNWAQLDVLSPGETTFAPSTAEGPWCTYDFAGSYLIGGIAYSTYTGYMTLSCSNF